MRAKCNVCGRAYEAKTERSSTCSATCRSRKARGAARAAQDPNNSLVKATRLELEAAGKVDTVFGQLALSLAARMKSDVTGISALSRELRTVLAAAVGSVTPTAGAAADQLDELRARRDAKRAG